MCSVAVRFTLTLCIYSGGEDGENSNHDAAAANARRNATKGGKGMGERLDSGGFDYDTYGGGGSGSGNGGEYWRDS